MAFDLSGRWVPDTGSPLGGAASMATMWPTRGAPQVGSAAPSGLADLVANLRANMTGPGMDLLTGRTQIGAPVAPTAPTAPITGPTRPLGPGPFDPGRMGPPRRAMRDMAQRRSDLQGASALPAPTSGMGSNASPWGQMSGLQSIANML